MITMWIIAFFISVLIFFGLFGLWIKGRKAFLRPSGALLGLTFILFLVPHIIYKERIENLTEYGDIAFLYTAIFVLGNLIYVCAMLALGMDSGFPRHSVSADNESVICKRLFFTIFAILSLILMAYFSFVPWASTGLYAILFDSANATMAREDSLKLLGVPWLQYAYLMGFSMLAPLIVVCAIELYFIEKKLDIISFVIIGSVVSLYLLITGARIGVANMVLVSFIWIVIKRDMRVHFREIVLFGILFLSIPIILSVVREGVSNPDFLEYLEAVSERIFLLPTAITGWYIEYVYDFGFVDFFSNNGNITNDVALQYIARHERIGADSVTTPTAYFVQNYTYWGWLGLIPSWIALVLIDMPSILADRLPSSLRRPCLAVLLYFSIILMQSGFGTTMISHGYFILSFLIIILYTYFQNQKRYLRHG